MKNIKDILAILEKKHGKMFKLFRYVISGGTAALVDIGFLYVFTRFLGFWYILSAILAFILAFVVSFTLQKYWTFRDYSGDRIVKQSVIYFIVGLINLLLNTLLMYLFTDIARLHYIVSQIIAGLLIACISFFVYKNIIFSK